MSLIQFDLTRCKKDGACAQVCVMGCIEMGADGPRATEGGTCIGCGHCVAVCAHGALRNVQLPTEAFQPFPSEFPTPASVRGLMLSRRSVREFKDRPLPVDVLTRLVDTARYAPTGGNSQQTAWTVCVDESEIRNVAALAMEWLRGDSRFAGMARAWDQGQDVVLRRAPALVVTSCPQSYGIGSADCAIALSYLELAAASEGVGACWAGLLMMAAEKHPGLNSMLRLPKGYVVHGALMLGYPKFRYHSVPPRRKANVTWI